MQDWEWEVADATRFYEFLIVYRSSDLTQNQLFTLMEILIQCLEETSESEFEDTWLQIRFRLLENINIHFYTIIYWACIQIDEEFIIKIDDISLENYFRVTPLMRQLLKDLKLSIPQ